MDRYAVWNASLREARVVFAASFKDACQMLGWAFEDCWPMRLPAMPHFDGETYEPELDYERLGAQMRRVCRALLDEEWHTLEELALLTGDPTPSVSARIRDLRKPKFGRLQVLRKRVGDPKAGLFAYRLCIALDG